MRLYNYVGSANGYKVELLCALLGKTYERVEVSIFEGDGQKLRAKNPTGAVPILELDDGTCLPESNAILVHLARGTAYWPASDRDQDQVLRWLMYEQSDVEPVIGSARFWTLTGRDRGDELGRRVEWAKKTLGILDGEFAQRPWLVGATPTVADIAVYAYSHLAGDLGLTIGAHMRAWCDRIEALPHYIAGPGPYDASARAR